MSLSICDASIAAMRRNLKANSLGEATSISRTPVGNRDMPLDENNFPLYRGASVLLKLVFDEKLENGMRQTERVTDSAAPSTLLSQHIRDGLTTIVMVVLVCATL
jgi:hypothetical protein